MSDFPMYKRSTALKQTLLTSPMKGAAATWLSIQSLCSALDGSNLQSYDPDPDFSEFREIWCGLMSTFL